MATMVWKKLVGHQRIKETLAPAVDNNALGHAYLLCGEEGVGKLQAALELAYAVLCDSDAARPCYKCESCRKVERHAHPDFNLVVPVCLAKQHKSSDRKLSEQGWAYLDEVCKAKVADPYSIEQHAGIATIPVEWVREVNHSILRGSTDARPNVAIICGIDIMNKESANAMLKTLEEPPQNTLIILTTDRPHAVLPTIISRCQIVRLGYVGMEDMTDALCRQSGLNRDDARIVHAVRCAEGSLGKARMLLEQPIEELLGNARQLLDMCAESDWLSIAAQLDELLNEQLDSGRDYGTAEQWLSYIVYLIRDSYLDRIGVTEKYIRKEFVSEGSGQTASNAGQADKVLSACQKAIRALRARGNVHMVLVTFLFTMMEILHGEKQQSG